MRQVHIYIFGNVQGVFFRKQVKELADKLSLKGFVQNVDNKVEVVAQGDEDHIADLMSFCLKGPKGAKVKNLDYNDEELDEFEGFEIVL